MLPADNSKVTTGLAGDFAGPWEKLLVGPQYICKKEFFVKKSCN